jgi:hypothetical protein
VVRRYVNELKTALLLGVLGPMAFGVNGYRCRPRLVLRRRRAHPPAPRNLYADRGQISGLYERAVLLAADVDDLDEPNEPIPSRRDDHPRGIETPLEAGLRRSRDWITGRR